jgi:hypothetical protein
MLTERGAGEDHGEPDDRPQREAERDGHQSGASGENPPRAQAMAVTAIVTTSMAEYPCGNETAAPDP